MDKKKLIALIVIIVAIVAAFFVMGNFGLNITNDQRNSSNSLNGSVDGDKILIVYFSQTGNTETIANDIHEKVGGNLVKLETVKPYTSNYDDLSDYALEEKNNNSRPELKTNITNIDDYDVIFLGYPIWWSTCPMPIMSFLDSYDLSDKTIIPFATHGGSGLSGTDELIKNNTNATVLEGFDVTGSSAGNAKNDVNNWLDRIGF